MLDLNFLGSLFFFELALGIFVFLTLSSAAPVGPFFYRMNGAFALLCLSIGWWMGWEKMAPGATAFEFYAFGSLLAALAFFCACAPVKNALRKAFLVGAVLGVSLALGAGVYGFSGASLSSTLLFTLSAATSGMIVGGIGIAMVLGHWYLTVPDMKIFHLKRINGVTIAAIALKIFCIALLLLLFAASLQGEEKDFYRPMSLFFFGTRVLVGLLVPLVFAFMVWGCLKHQATRSATGILYASTIFVIVGESLGLMLWNSYGVPL